MERSSSLDQLLLTPYFCKGRETRPCVNTTLGLTPPPWKRPVQARVPMPKLRELHSESAFAHFTLTLLLFVRVPWLQATESTPGEQAHISSIFSPPSTEGKAEQSFHGKQFGEPGNKNRWVFQSIPVPIKGIQMFFSLCFISSKNVITETQWLIGQAGPPWPGQSGAAWWARPLRLGPMGAAESPSADLGAAVRSGEMPMGGHPPDFPLWAPSDLCSVYRIVL